MFGHSRLTDLVGTTGDVMGAAYAAGHRNIATTAVYLHGQEKDAARMLATYAEKQAAHPNCGGIVGGGDEGDETPALQETTETLVSKGFGQSGREDSNLRPSDPQSDALTRLRYAPRRRKLVDSSLQASTIAHRIVTLSLKHLRAPVATSPILAASKRA